MAHLCAAIEKRAVAPFDAFFGLRLDDTFDDVRDGKTHAPLGPSFWDEAL